ncbi:MAG: hypothetical protein R3Y50_00710 [Rikenellaceae bacterium]
MGLFSNLFGFSSKKKQEDDGIQSDVEEFMSLISIYNQATVISHVGITNIKMVPEFANYKRIMRLPAVGGKLGLAEKAHIKKSLMAEYEVDELFFKELDSSIRRNCKGLRDVQNYFFAFGNFTNDLLTLLSTEFQWKLQGSMLIKKLLRSTVKNVVGTLMTKLNWKDRATTDMANRVKATAMQLGFSQQWMEELVYQIYALSRKKKKK